MIRAFYTSVTGMVAQQNNIDIISNNISNINTVGYKKEKGSFKDTLYSTMERRPQPTNLQVGSGAKIGATQRYLEQGLLEPTDNSLDVGIYGMGFFKVADRNGNVRYTRDGSFKLSSETDEQGAVFRLVTSDGNYVLDANTETPLSFRAYYPEYDMTFSQENVVISEDGTVSLTDGEQNSYDIGRIQVVSFANPEGLEAIGDNIYTMPEGDGSITGPEMVDRESKLVQGHLERSNVEMAKEMTDLLLAQRAYQMSSRVLQSADEMERLANDLRN